jgi:tRNA (cmo5U34)-methyltransferase
MSERPVEEMDAFFDARAHGYDSHMERTVTDLAEFYQAIATEITPTSQPVSILDIGCGTGLELSGILAQAPRAQLTCNDLSLGMLEKLKPKYHAHADQISFLVGSYTELPLGTNRYEYVVSAMTVHHLLPEPKVALYRKIHEALKPDGSYIEGDFVVDAAEEQEYLEYYQKKMQALDPQKAGLYHLDLPFTVEKQIRLLTEAGFRNVTVTWHKGAAAVFRCTKE